MTKPIQSNIIMLFMQRKLLIIRSLYGEPKAQEHVNREMEHVRGLSQISNKFWQVVKVAFTSPILSYLLPLNFNNLRGIGDRVVRRLALNSWAKEYG